MYIIYGLGSNFGITFLASNLTESKLLNLTYEDRNCEFYLYYFKEKTNFDQTCHNFTKTSTMGSFNPWNIDKNIQPCSYEMGALKQPNMLYQKPYVHEHKEILL